MKLLPLFLIGFLSSCAAIMSGSMQNVTVITPDVDGASCSLTDSKGREWEVKSTPGSTLVRKGDGPISVICKKEGYHSGTGQLKESTAPAVAGNILMPLGFAVDSLTGSGEQYDSSIEIEMESLTKKKPWE